LEDSQAEIEKKAMRNAAYTRFFLRGANQARMTEFPSISISIARSQLEI
jgi:hypothetical protein